AAMTAQTPAFQAIGTTLAKWSALDQAAADATVAKASHSYARGRTLLVLLALIAIAVGAGIALLVTRAITRPGAQLKDRLTTLEGHCLTHLTEALEAAAEGDLTIDVVPVTTPVEVRSHDELGQLSATFNGVLDKTQRSVGAYNAMRGQLAELIGA